MLANSGHFDVEIDKGALATLATGGMRRIREFVDEYTLADGRRLHLLGEGRLVNLAAAEGHPAAVMDMSFANQALSVEWVVKNHADAGGPRSTRCPRISTREVARLKLQRDGRRDRRADRRAGGVPAVVGAGDVSGVPGSAGRTLVLPRAREGERGEPVRLRRRAPARSRRTGVRAGGSRRRTTCSRARSMSRRRVRRPTSSCTSRCTGSTGPGRSPTRIRAGLGARGLGRGGASRALRLRRRRSRRPWGARGPRAGARMTRADRAGRVARRRGRDLRPACAPASGGRAGVPDGGRTSPRRSARSPSGARRSSGWRPRTRWRSPRRRLRRGRTRGVAARARGRRRRACVATRPTAVNLAWAVDADAGGRARRVLLGRRAPTQRVHEAMVAEAVRIETRGSRGVRRDGRGSALVLVPDGRERPHALQHGDALHGRDRHRARA